MYQVHYRYPGDGNELVTTFATEESADAYCMIIRAAGFYSYVEKGQDR